jgi:hypothetical protein
MKQGDFYSNRFSLDQNLPVNLNFLTFWVSHSGFRNKLALIIFEMLEKRFAGHVTKTRKPSQKAGFQFDNSEFYFSLSSGLPTEFLYSFNIRLLPLFSLLFQ